MTVTLTTQALPYPGVHNIRCLGGYETDQGGTTRADAIWRGCALTGIAPDDHEDLLARGLSTIIDLRRGDEIAHAPNPLADDPRVLYVNIPLFDGLDPIDRMAEETGGQFDFGVRYRLALDTCQENMAAVLRTIAQAAPGGVYFHCTAGKDRTGLIAMLLLANAGVHRDVIAAEYGLTARLGASLMDQLRAIIIDRGQTPERTAQILASEPRTMLGVLDHLDATYGGPIAYLDQIGIDAALRAQLVARLV
ncbi:tyrosine-protein phosphatase [Pseudooceanicola nitratireducens]|uniref:tyrosine-protein phosphatase n=1 Tax=Pseudooceanicola nitratireducens TaxID=517719 RepID=UPI001C95ACAB|nr:tyrosine-protein phosphatase [Pseudooceanicola nitratireducens]MBY6165371.1 tyrosine-protein phosphatase [Pseudooceanicola nitratireducens]